MLAKPMRSRHSSPVLALAACLLLVACTRGQPTAESPTTASSPNLSASEMAQAEQRGQLCSAANASGVGLRGEYFSLSGQAGEPVLKRIDATVDFDSTLEWPTELATQRPRSVRWSGWLKAPLTGIYRLHVTGQGAKLTVANRTFEDSSAADAPIDLAAGRFYPVRIELDLPPSTSSRIRLEWTAPHGARYVVPRPLLFQPTEPVRSTGS